MLLMSLWRVLVNGCTSSQVQSAQRLRGVVLYRLDKPCASRCAQALEDHVQDCPQYGNPPALQSRLLLIIEIGLGEPVHPLTCVSIEPVLWEDSCGPSRAWQSAFQRSLLD